nr:unnamed protein product [Callosobruchus analis]
MSELVRRRGIMKAKISRFSTFLDEISIQDDASKIIELKNRLAKVEEIYTEFEDIQSQIEQETSDIVASNSERELFEDIYFSVIARAQQKESATQLRHLLYTVSKHIRELAVLGQPTQQWDLLLINVLSPKLDTTTHREWEQRSAKHKELSTFQQFSDFILQRCQVLESLKRSVPVVTHRSTGKPATSKRTQSDLVAENTTKTCIVCQKGSHRLFACEDFLNLEPEKRLKEVEKPKLCLNCLQAGHTRQNCNSGTCRKCNKKHNTLLHTDAQSSGDTKPQESSKTSERQTNGSEIAQVNLSTTLVCSKAHQQHQILLSTAAVDVTRNGRCCTRRALLDTGSELNFITEDTCRLLQVTPQSCSIPIKGIANHASCSDEELSTQLRKFWEPEELPEVATLSKEEQACEHHFETAHARDSHGRFVVRLPFKSNPDLLGQSKPIALKRFSYLNGGWTNSQGSGGSAKSL